MVAAETRYGLPSAPPTRHSMCWLLSSPGMNRNAAVRLSMPQVAAVGAHAPLDEAGEAVDRRRQHRQEFRHVPNQAAERPTGAIRHAGGTFVAGKPVALLGEQREVVVAALAGIVHDHLAMNVAMAPRFAKNDFEKVLNSAARSAASMPSDTASAASQTPGPVSQCRPLQGHAEIGAVVHQPLETSELLEARSTE